ncbi:MAG: hypothetical protein EpisKO_15330 [Epibacterium sp.]
MADDKTLLTWPRTDLAVAWHGSQARRAWSDPANKAAEQGKADMANTMLRRLGAYEAGQPPIHPRNA